MNNLFLKLPITFDTELLRKDLDRCLQFQFIDHFNEKDYEGQWTSIALRSPTGDPRNIFAFGQGDNTFQDTLLLDECSYFRNLVEYFKCPKQSIRLLNLMPNSRINEHSDHGLSYRDGAFRLHIPIKTNEQVTFYLKSHPIKMSPGECWYANFGEPHRVENIGKTERIHIVMDCLRNPWTDRLFEKAGYDFMLGGEMHNSMDKDTVLKVIEELKLMKTGVSNKLIKELQAKLK